MKQDKLYGAALAVCILGLGLPAYTISAAGVTYTQYLLPAYQGLVPAIILLLYIVTQVIFYYKKKNWQGWPALVLGLYLAGFACFQFFRISNTFSVKIDNTLATSVQASSSVAIGTYISLLGGFSVIACSVLKIKKELYRNKMQAQS